MKRLLISILILAGAVSASAQDLQNFERQESKLLQVFNLMTNYYVDSLAPEKVAQEAIVNLLAELDPHSYYFTPEEMAAAEEQIDGSFSGIGIEFDVLKDTLRVVSVIPNSPSENVGLQPNDRIVGIDSENVVGIKRDRVPKLLRGKKGTLVTLNVLRRGETLNFKITRDDIPIHSVDAAYKLDNGWGYIKVNSFADATMREFNSALRKFGAVYGLVIDLRDNGGGLLQRAIEMCELFLSRGQKVVSIEGRAIGSEIFRSRTNGVHRATPLIVMIDESSASASEIVSGAMQDWDRGIVVGQTSFGKGVVQRRFPLADGSSVSITIARYHTPSGRVIQRPYKMGDNREYYIDHLRRAYDKEYADSVLKNAPHFETLRTKRTVIGSGGIVPDIIVTRDTTQDFRYWNRLSAEGIVNEWVNLWLGTNRAELMTKYPTAEQYIAEFEITDDIMAELKNLALSRGIEPHESAETSEPAFKNILRALIARKLWDTTAYYRIVNPTDETYIRTLELIKDWDNSKKMLEK